MPQENEITPTIREGDIYRQWAMTLLNATEFAYSPNANSQNKYNLITIQKYMSALGGITNNYLLKRCGDPNNKEINDLITRQQEFIKATPDKAEELKQKILKICYDYDDLCLKNGIFK